MLKPLVESKHKNTILSHVSKISKGDLPIQLSPLPLKLSSLGNSLPRPTAKTKDHNHVQEQQSTRLLTSLKKQEMQLLLHGQDTTTCQKTNDVQKLIEMLLVKRLGCTNKLQQIQGLKQAIIQSVCLRMLCNNVLQQLQKKGRLGSDLKGINKKILGEIQNLVGDVMIKQVKLFENRMNFKSQCQKLSGQLKSYKDRILQNNNDYYLNKLIQKYFQTYFNLISWTVSKSLVENSIFIYMNLLRVIQKYFYDLDKIIIALLTQMNQTPISIIPNTSFNLKPKGTIQFSNIAKPRPLTPKSSQILSSNNDNECIAISCDARSFILELLNIILLHPFFKQVKKQQQFNQIVI